MDDEHEYSANLIYLGMHKFTRSELINIQTALLRMASKSSDPDEKKQLRRLAFQAGHERKRQFGRDLVRRVMADAQTQV